MNRFWWRQLGALVRKEAQQIVRDPSSYLVAGVLPLLFLFLFGYGITLDPGILRLAILNESGGTSSQQLAAAFAHSPWFAVQPVGSMPEAERLMRDSRVQGVLVLRQDFDACRERGAPAQLMLIVDGTEPNIATFIQSYGQGSSAAGRVSRRPAARPSDPPWAWNSASGSIPRPAASDSSCPGPSPSL